jgi:hypothetical protein
MRLEAARVLNLDRAVGIDNDTVLRIDSVQRSERHLSGNLMAKGSKVQSEAVTITTTAVM